MRVALCFAGQPTEERGGRRKATDGRTDFCLRLCHSTFGVRNYDTAIKFGKTKDLRRAPSLFLLKGGGRATKGGEGDEERFFGDPFGGVLILCALV